MQLATLGWGRAGPTILLIHGLTSMARSWWRMSTESARAGYRVTRAGPGHSVHRDSYAGFWQAVRGFLAGRASSPKEVGRFQLDRELRRYQ
ncbi:MAG TPA: hypothetical protein VFD47_13180 [Actinomycetota bacterium]|nr:hypothetical protein [Actinomycetota bacterium]